MSFYSQNADRIWEDLYNVLIPEQLTLSDDYIRIYGVHTSHDKKYAEMMATNLINVKIPIIKMLEYYGEGIRVEIPSRKDLISIHKHIEAYLSEWRDYLKFNINSAVNNNKDLLLALEKLSKEIYGKAYPEEVLDRLFDKQKTIGIFTPMAQKKLDNEELEKPKYEGISSLVKSKRSKPLERW